MSPPPPIPPPVPAPPAAGTPPRPPAGQEPPAAPDLDDRERRLDPKVVGVWRVIGALSALVPLAAVSVAGFLLLDRLAWLVAAAALASFLLLVVWYPRARYSRWRWQLTPLALELRYGVIVWRHEAMPYFRIQQIDITQGPLDRLLRLATLQVTTASASGSVVLPGITASDAPDVRAALLARTSAAVAAHPGDLQDAV